MRDFFSAAVISPEVLGVLLETRFLGRQYGVPLFSPFLRPQGFPVRTSTHSSLNQRLSAAPLAVLRTATGFLLSALGYSAGGIGRREDFIRCFHFAIAVIFGRPTFLKCNRLYLAHAPTLQHYLAFFLAAAALFFSCSALSNNLTGASDIVFLLKYQ